MGIKKYFGWFKNTFSNSITRLRKGEKMSTDEKHVDTLLLDMNGIFHTCAQKVYEYGNFKPPQRFLRKEPNKTKKQVEFFALVCSEIDRIVGLVNPRKKLIMCVDGTAPLSKQNQQRARRFVSARDRTDNTSFDSASITPGTKLMDGLSKYIDWFIKKKLSAPGPWQKLEIVFSNEKVPGEGEQKCLAYLRKHGDKNDTYCIYGMDADLIMLTLISHVEKFYILREDPYDMEFDHFVIDMCSVRKQLANILAWESKTFEFSPETVIDDFVLMCFSVGNDFLPHIPCIEILEGGIDDMINTYKTVASVYGHLTEKTESGTFFRKKPLKVFFKAIGAYEKDILQNKMLRKDWYFPDIVLERNTTRKITDEKCSYELDMEEYKKDFYQTNLPEVDQKTLCHNYLEGIQWVLTYYTKGVPTWTWRFPYHYAPFSSTLAEHVDTFELPKEYEKTTPSLPFVQLLGVLAPKSASLLPEPLDKLLTSAKSPLNKYCPEDFIVDTSGCKQEWEGIVLIPMIDYSTVKKLYTKMIISVDEKEKKRNVFGKSLVYRFSDTDPSTLVSCFGNFECLATSEVIVF
jgi:5'-3' exonuclease